jgi:N-acyl-L-homoserine lactone synthetase
MPPEPSGVLADLLRLRCEIYVGRRGWRELAVDNGAERDAFDGPDAVYAIALAAGERIAGGFRLLPTNRPHLLSCHFKGLAARGVPTGEDIFELTRFFVAPRIGPGVTRRQAVDALAAVVMAVSRDLGIAALTSVVDTFLLASMRRVGWDFEPLGPAAAYPGGRAIAVRIAVADDCAPPASLVCTAATTEEGASG